MIKSRITVNFLLRRTSSRLLLYILSVLERCFYISATVLSTVIICQTNMFKHICCWIYHKEFVSSKSQTFLKYSLPQALAINVNPALPTEIPVKYLLLNFHSDEVPLILMIYELERTWQKTWCKNDKQKGFFSWLNIYYLLIKCKVCTIVKYRTDVFSTDRARAASWGPCRKNGGTIFTVVQTEQARSISIVYIIWPKILWMFDENSPKYAIFIRLPEFYWMR